MHHPLWSGRPGNIYEYGHIRNLFHNRPVQRGIRGAVLTPLLLPYLPRRAFALKDLLLGLIAAVVLITFRNADIARWADRLEILVWFLLVPAVAAYLAMNFTGASTYTSLLGVKKEMLRVLPLQITAGTAGCLLWLGSRFIV